MDYLTANNIPYPPHFDAWVELDYARILRFKGDVNATTLPGILEFWERLEKSGLPVKNLIMDGAKVSDIDSSTVAAILAEMKKNDHKIGLINVPEELRSYLEILHQSEHLQIFASEKEAVEALNKKEELSAFPAMRRSLKKNRALSLLIALLMFLITLPFFESNMMGIVYLLFFTFVLLSGIYAVSYNMRHVAGGVLLAAPTLITAWSNVFIRDQQILNAEMTFLTIFLMYTIAVILKHILSVRTVRLNELYGAICVYIMVGMTFGVVYALLHSLDSGAIAFPPGETTASMTSFFYFSFVSMSSTGFSGFTAVSPMARSIVIVQVIIGVMYVAALIGKLVSANTPDDDGLFDHLEAEARLKSDMWSQEAVENFFRRRPFLLVLSMAMLNYASSVLMTVLRLPFFMDSWGTSLAVVLGGLWPGVISGIIYNLVMAWTFWGPQAWVWMFCNILVAVLTLVFLKAGWIDLHKPVKLLAAGVLTGIVNSGVVALITYAANMPIYQGTMAVYHFFMNMTGKETFASAAEKVAVEVADKTIAFLLVAVAVIFIRDLFDWGKKAAARPLKTLAVLLCFLCAAPNARAATFESPLERVTVIELFSSEGCSSCPPADNYINSLRKDPRLWKEFIPLVFHVDYWDHLGWKDPWSRNEFTQRQSAYGRAWGTDTIYTPGMVLNGTEWADWYGQRRLIDFKSGQTAGVLQADVNDEGKVRVTFYPKGQRTPLWAHAAILGFDQVSNVTAGENTGRKLVHHFNVLEHVQSEMTGKEGTFTGELILPDFTQYDKTKHGLAVWVSSGDNPTPVQATGGKLEETPEEDSL